MQNFDLNTPLQYLKGVGPQKFKYLQELGLTSIKNLVFYFPRTWEDRRVTKSISNLLPNEKTTIFAEIEATSLTKTRNNIVIFEALVRDKTGSLTAKWFRKLSRKFDVLFYLKKDLKKENFVFLTGENTFGGFIVSDYEIYDENSAPLFSNRIIPIYNATEKLDSKFILKCQHQVLNDPNFEITEFLPKKICEKYELMSFGEALKKIHFSTSEEEQQKAYFRLAFNEFFLLEIILMKEYSKIKKTQKTQNYILKKNLLEPFKKNLQFTFTRDQKKAINEIFEDLMSKEPMNRLLQGDVGSGKTVVALPAILLACENEFQTVFMAPTEVLAKQHFETLANLTGNLGLRIELLTGSLTKKNKTLLKEKIAKGEIDIVIGTHAVFSEAVKFHDLKLIVIDEQHKFGVRERLLLREKAENPDILFMTATPIPRTLAMSIYGDLDLSTIKSLPEGRNPVKTFVTAQRKAIEFLINEIKRGHQGFIIYPAVDEENKLELKAAKAMFEDLKKTYFDDKNIEIGLLHGKMKQSEKDAVMQSFSENKIKALVATTVVEVGVNIPNATVMIIENAERFGLSTLHQLRGRVGRSVHESFCFLVPEKLGQISRQRLEIMTKTNDGFLLAETDLKLRGPGEFLGKNQHGFLNLGIGDITKDLEIIELARDEAKTFFTEIKNYKPAELAKINQEIEAKYGEKIDFLKA